MTSATMNQRPRIDELLRIAETRRTPTPISQAHEELGELFDETLLDGESLVIRSGEIIALTPTTYHRVVKRAITRQSEVRKS